MPGLGYLTGTAAAGQGGAQAAPASMHTRAHAHTLPGMHTHTHTQSKAPHPSAGTPDSPSPSQCRGEHPLSLERRWWWWVAGSPSEWRQACSPQHTPPPLQLGHAGRGEPAPHRAPHGREGEGVLCPAEVDGEGVLGGHAWERGCCGCSGHHGVQSWGGGGCGRAGRGTACSGRAAPREHVPCGKGGAQALAKTVIPSPKWRAWTPDMGGPPQPGCHPRPGRGSWSPFV